MLGIIYRTLATHLIHQAGHIKATAHTGAVTLFRIYGWRDRFFSVPHSFYFARTNPRKGWFGEDWTALYSGLPDDVTVWYLPPFPAGFLEDAGAVWKRLLAFTLLSREERLCWESLPSNPA
ncbi:MAG: hypothetical protein BMS9Abin06_0715 [Gammaproteobacteria bacterium]|nr:MAG: hypothetical protein BMS9Abin06_0715 [Gammaproteobacteria bacterium]